MRFVETIDTRFESPLITVYDYRCEGAEPGLLLGEVVFDAPCIVFPRRGVFRRHEGRRAVVGDPNHVLFFDAGAPFRIGYPAGGGDESTFLLLKEVFLADLLRAHDPRFEDARGVRCPIDRTPSDSSLYLQHRAILRGCREKGVDGFALEEGVVRLARDSIAAAFRLVGVVDPPVREKTRRVHRETAESLKAVLGGRYRETLSLDDLARIVHSSPYHLCRLFKKETGMTIHRYRTRLRLRESLERVLDGAGSLTDLALDLGFSSHSHFTDAFRREFGLSPTRLREIASLRLVASLESRLVA